MRIFINCIFINCICNKEDLQVVPGLHDVLLPRLRLPGLCPVVPAPLRPAHKGGQGGVSPGPDLPQAGAAARAGGGHHGVREPLVSLTVRPARDVRAVEPETESAGGGGGRGGKIGTG